VIYTVMIFIVHLLVIIKSNWEIFGALCRDITGGDDFLTGHVLSEFDCI